ncbi:hypothetical protein BGX30_013248 [Mortierella sp. GBA39]|nr:hypothetical protein BGX30_013248 [Mortierella sp. GBA39]
MPTSGTRQNFLQAYKNRKNSGVSGLDAKVAALQHQEVANGAGGSRRSSLGEPLKQQHPHFWERTKQVPQGTNQQDYVMQIPLHDPRQQQKQEYQVVQENVYSTQPRGQQQQQHQQTRHVQHHQQQQYNSLPRAQQQQQQQYYQQQNKNQQQPQHFQQEHSSQQQYYNQNQPNYQPHQAYQQFQQQQNIQ